MTKPISINKGTSSLEYIVCVAAVVSVLIVLLGYPGIFRQSLQTVLSTVSNEMSDQMADNNPASQEVASTSGDPGSSTTSSTSEPIDIPTIAGSALLSDPEPVPDTANPGSTPEPTDIPLIAGSTLPSDPGTAPDIFTSDPADATIVDYTPDPSDQPVGGSGRPGLFPGGSITGNQGSPG